jgi:hypothetical protein
MKRLTDLASAAAFLLLASSAQAADYVDLPIDSPTKVEGVSVACTGVGQTKHDPQWRDYSVRVEFSDAQNTYLGGGQIAVSGRQGRTLLKVRCDAPWILLKLSPGEYAVEGRPVDSAAKPRSASFHAPGKGQMRLVLQFPDA